VKDDSNGKFSRKGIEIYRHRMRDKAWGIRECSENGKRTANIDKLTRGDEVLFYLGGNDGHCFVGTCVLDSGFQNAIEIAVHAEYLDWNHGVLLKDISQWTRSLQIESLRGKVHFVPVGENFGSYLQGSVTRISERDYNTVINEHTRQG